jgi:hypothetical protein
MRSFVIALADDDLINADAMRVVYVLAIGFVLIVAWFVALGIRSLWK